MDDKVYTQSELKAQNIITTDYVLNLEPGKFIAVLDMKAEARNCLRVFFTFEDSRKVMATTQWWQRYLGFYEIPVGTHLLLPRFQKQTLYLFKYSVVDQVVQDDLLGSAADAVHPSDPFHLILGFQLFGHAFRFLHLLDQPVEHFLSRFADLFQMGF